jgi:hypothetical protein
MTHHPSFLESTAKDRKKQSATTVQDTYPVVVRSFAMMDEYLGAIIIPIVQVAERI